MKQLSAIQKGLLCLLVLVSGGILVLAAVQYFYEGQGVAVSGKLLKISHDSGFYTESLNLQVSGAGVHRIYYTLDGSVPSENNPTARLYENGIELLSTDTETIYSLKLVAYFWNGKTSDVVRRTYIIGANVEERFEVPVLCLTSSEETFFDEEIGMLIGENKYARGRESEREIAMTLFDEAGEVQLSQDCGIRLYGAFSRAKNQPSFRLYARSEYDEQNDFEHMFFTNQYTDDNALIAESKRIVVRNSGNDNGYTFIRSELATRLCLDAGYPDAPSASPVAVYFNNTYYGAYWFITNFDDTYFTSTYGEYEGTMYTLEGTINELTIPEGETDENVISLVDAYNSAHDFFAEADLNMEENWVALNEFMDVENFLQYMAIHNYMCNTDSLHNNYKIYRYVAPEGGEYTKESVFDGRYRFLLYDLDYAFGWTDNGVSMSTTNRMNSTDDDTKFFRNLMSREDCREYYIRYMLSLQNYYFSEGYAGPILDEMHASRESELRYTYTTTDLLIDNYPAPDVTLDEDIKREMDRLRSFLVNRKDYVAQDLSGIFGPFTTYDLKLANPQGANITLDYATFNDATFTGMYYKEVPIAVSAEAKPGYQFDYWLVNGEKYEEASFEITQEMINGDSFSLECICSPDPEADLVVTAIKTRGNGDYIRLTNLGSEARNIKGYYLTDDDTWNKCPLPSIYVEPGASVTIYCKNYTGIEALGQPYVDFNLKAGEQLSLYHSDQELLQTLTVPQLGLDDGVYEMDMETGEFREVYVESY